jgi:hypothetical protein
MQVSPTQHSATSAVPDTFQQPLLANQIEQVAPLFTLPLEMLIYIGRMCADVPDVIAYTRTCKCLYALRPKILTTDVSKVQGVLERLLRNPWYLAAFLEVCKHAPKDVRLASFKLQPSYSNQLHNSSLILAVLPNVKVNLIQQDRQFVRVDARAPGIRRAINIQIIAAATIALADVPGPQQRFRPNIPAAHALPEAANIMLQTLRALEAAGINLIA